MSKNVIGNLNNLYRYSLRMLILMLVPIYSDIHFSVILVMKVPVKIASCAIRIVVTMLIFSEKITPKKAKNSRMMLLF